MEFQLRGVKTRRVRKTFTETIIVKSQFWFLLNFFSFPPCLSNLERPPRPEEFKILCLQGGDYTLRWLPVQVPFSNLLVCKRESVQINVTNPWLIKNQFSVLRS